MLSGCFNAQFKHIKSELDVGKQLDRRLTTLFESVCSRVRKLKTQMELQFYGYKI